MKKKGTEATIKTDGIENNRGFNSKEGRKISDCHSHDEFDHSDLPEALNLLNTVESRKSIGSSPDLNRNTVRWTSKQLDQFRLKGDPAVDPLVETILSEQGSNAVGRVGYNNMLMLADQLIAKPELALIKESRLSKQLNENPRELVEYFDPMIAPDWVDPEKINLGAKLWQENTLITLGVLYAASLPSCYVIKKGIPALYQTEKLRDAKYIFQRIYETGLMLADTMDSGGLAVIEDADYDHDQLLYKALNNLDKKGQWKKEGHGCCRTHEENSPEIKPDELRAEIERLRGKPTRYLWGKGYLSAKKVRFLHASMRFMLTQPNCCSPSGNPEKPLSMTEALSHKTTPWDQAEFGTPINQEDLAYTLLTFGYTIPKGLAHWGVPVSIEQKEAFLHLWKVVGYVMGVHPELLTDHLDEAEQLFTLVQSRQAASSEEAVILTESLMGFFADYLPHLPGFANRLSTALIISQLGMEQASLIISEQEIKATYCWWRRPFYSTAGFVFRLFFSLRGGFYKGSGILGAITFSTIHQASLHLIDSWRGAYIRQPFFIPVNDTTWIRKPGVDEAHIQKLKHWRRELFLACGISICLLIIALFSFAAVIPFSILDGKIGLYTSLAIGFGSWISSMGLMNTLLPIIFNRRPKPKLVTPKPDS